MTDPATITLIAVVVLQVVQLGITAFKSIKKSECFLGSLHVDVENFEPNQQTTQSQQNEKNLLLQRTAK